MSEHEERDEEETQPVAQQPEELASAAPPVPPVPASPPDPSPAPPAPPPAAAPPSPQAAPPAVQPQAPQPPQPPPLPPPPPPDPGVPQPYQPAPPAVPAAVPQATPEQQPVAPPVPSGQPGAPPAPGMGFVAGPEFVAQRANPMAAGGTDTQEPAEALESFAVPAPVVPIDVDSWNFGGSAGPVSKIPVPEIPGGPFARIGIAIVVVIGLILATMHFLLPHGGAAQLISLRFPQGSDPTYRMSMSMTGSVSAQGDTVPFLLQLSATESMVVRSVTPDGTATIDYTIKNIAYKTQPPVPYDYIPKTVSGSLQIAPDGKILSGDLGLSSIGAGGRTPGGWDQFSPLLPDHAVAPGDTWKQDFELPLPFGSDTLKVSSESRLLAFNVENGDQVAVVKTTTKVPLDYTATWRDIENAGGSSSTSATSAAIPADTKFVYGGSITMVTTSRIDTNTKQLLGLVSQGDMSVKVNVEGLPSEIPDPGEISLTGSFTYSEEKATGARASRKSPEAKSAGASATPQAKAS